MKILPHLRLDMISVLVGTFVTALRKTYIYLGCRMVFLIYINIFKWVNQASKHPSSHVLAMLFVMKTLKTYLLSNSQEYNALLITIVTLHKIDLQTLFYLSETSYTLTNMFPFLWSFSYSTLTPGNYCSSIFIFREDFHRLIFHESDFLKFHTYVGLCNIRLSLPGLSHWEKCNVVSSSFIYAFANDRVFFSFESEKNSIPLCVSMSAFSPISYSSAFCVSSVTGSAMVCIQFFPTKLMLKWIANLTVLGSGAAFKRCLDHKESSLMKVLKQSCSSQWVLTLLKLN